MQDEIEVRIYETSTGQRPYAEWEANLDPTVQGVIWGRLNRVRMGNFGDCKPVKGTKVFELRFDYGPGYRLYFGKQGHHLVILLVGGSKRSQSGDIKKASNYWQDYQLRRNED